MSRSKVYFAFFLLTKPPNHMIQTYLESARNSLQVHFWKYFPMVKQSDLLFEYLRSNLIFILSKYLIYIKANLIYKKNHEKNTVNLINHKNIISSFRFSIAAKMGA